MDSRWKSTRSGRDLEVNQESNAPELQQPGLEPVQPGLETSHLQPNAGFGFVGSSYGKSNDYENKSSNPESSPTTNTVCGLRRTTFWLSVALALVIVLAVAIGGGVGGTVGQKNSIPSSTTPSAGSAAPKVHGATSRSNQVTVTQTVTSQVATATPSSPCPGANLQNYTSSSTGLTYTRVCGVDLQPSVARNNIVNGIFQDFDTCIGMCDSYNNWSGTSDMNVVIWSWAGTGTFGSQGK